MVDSVLGEIRPFAGSYAPEGWRFCDGSLLNINGNEALYSLLGVTWGGNGQTTFGLPDLRGRLPVGQGQGINLTARVVGQHGGSSEVQVVASNLPAHSHAFSVSTTTATTTHPTNGAVLAVPPATSVGPLQAYAPPTPAPTLENFDSTAITTAVGGNQAHPNVMPYLAVSYIIAVTGLYPERP